MKCWLSWASGVVLSVAAANAQSQERLDAHALAAAGDTTADEALGRTTGAFAWDGRLVLRAQRVQTVRLAGIELGWPLTSTRGFPLELVPVGVVGHAPHVVGGAHVYRLYEPSLPATFGGGVVELEPGVLPVVPTLELALGAGLHTSTTFQEGWSYEGGDADWLSIDDGTRALPDSAPSYGEMLPRGDRTLLGSAADFSGTWNAERSTPPPDLVLSARLGNRFPLSFGALGVHAALYLRNDWRSRDAIQNELALVGAGEAPRVSSRFDIEQTTRTARLAAALRLRLEYGGGGQALELHTWLVRGADDRTSVAEGEDSAIGVDLRSTELHWRDQQHFTQQLRGEQRLGSAGAPTLGWHYALGLAGEGEPDRREHAVTTAEPPQLVGPATRVFRANSQLTHDVGLDLRIPLLEQQLFIELGGLAQVASVELERRSFSWQPLTGSVAADLEELFAPASAGDSWEASETSGEALDSASTTFAGYALLDAELGVFSLQGGARLEHAAIEVEPRPAADADTTRFDDLHVAPSVQLGVRPMPMLDTHAAWSFTVDRPRPLELLNDFYAVDGRSSVGNPDLKAARAHNLELGARVNAEPEQARGADGLALTASYTRIADPIRRTTTLAGNWTYVNGDAAELWWLELEADKHFGFVAPWLADSYASIGLALPLAYDGAAIEEPFTGMGTAAGLDVPDYVLSARLAYDPARRGGKQGAVVALAYQAVAERTTVVDLEGWDESVGAVHRLDLHASYPLGHGFTLGASARNLIDAPIEGRYGGTPGTRYRLGRAIMLGVSFREPS